jgi:Tol biopolymer transport system component
VASLALVGIGLFATGARAQECPSERLRAQEVYALGLPDCRAYEQVTPVEKDGTNPGVAKNVVQASTAGDRIVFFVKANMPNAEGASTVPLFLADRTVADWMGPGAKGPEGLLPPSPPGVQDFVLGWSQDLSQTALLAHLAGDPGSSQNLYIRSSADSSLRLAVRDVGNDAFLDGFSADDRHLLFETPEQLSPDATAGVMNLYELNLSDDGLTLAGILPEGEGGIAPAGGSFGGPYEYALAPNLETGGAGREYYTQNTISHDGSRVVFTAGGTGRIYVRESDAVPPRTVAVSEGAAEWRAGTPDGANVFYTEAKRLYRFDVVTETREEITGVGSEVVGTLGAGAGGTRLYFVADGVLASNEGVNGSHAAPGDCNPQITVENRTCNLYEWDRDRPPTERVSFIAPQNTNEANGHSSGDANNWFPGNLNGEAKTSRVTPDGRALLFVSHLQLTSYDNTDVNTGQPDDELYLYDSARPMSADNPACVSCNPTGAAPSASPTLLRGTNPFEPPRVSQQTMTSNLSANGSRVFFETTEALVSQDTNEAQDVYEWERDGTGGCGPSSQGFSAGSGGCLYLISTGRSPDPSYFADAGSEGNDVFFLTDQPLVGQDQDRLLDVYDARVDGGLASQNPVSSTPCTGEECRGPTSPPIPFGSPSSAQFIGPGNPPSPVTAPTAKPKAKRPTRAQMLGKALRACKTKPRRQRPSCVERAKRKYGKSATFTKKHARGRAR